MLEIGSRLFVSFVDNDEQRLWLRSLLSAGSIGVVFTKKDGTEREMVCTLSAEMIPQDAAPKNSGRAQPTDSIAVFDLEKCEWRSFRFDSVKSIFTP